jgi:hypothetical protein
LREAIGLHPLVLLTSAASKRVDLTQLGGPVG